MKNEFGLELWIQSETRLYGGREECEDERFDGVNLKTEEEEVICGLCYELRLGGSSAFSRCANPPLHPLQFDFPQHVWAAARREELGDDKTDSLDFISNSTREDLN